MATPWTVEPDSSEVSCQAEQTVMKAEALVFRVGVKDEDKRVLGPTAGPPQPRFSLYKRFVLRMSVGADGRVLVLWAD